MNRQGVIAARSHRISLSDLTHSTDHPPSLPSAFDVLTLTAALKPIVHSIATATATAAASSGHVWVGGRTTAVIDRRAPVDSI